MRGVPLIVLGVLAVLAAPVWRWLEQPTQMAVRTAELLGRTAPEAPTVGPIILAIVGAFLILLGVILHTAPVNAQQPPRP
jgi:ABC-type phosphate transport system permease subunit